MMSFNSLYEILLSHVVLLCRYPLSILFMRFIMGKLWYRIWNVRSFNSLYEIRYTFSAQSLVPTLVFQFSLWDSTSKEEVISLEVEMSFNSLYEILSYFPLPLFLILRFSFNSLYEIPQASSHPSLLQLFHFQFSLWDSYNTKCAFNKNGK